MNRQSNLPTLPDLNKRYEWILDQVPADHFNDDERRLARLIGRIPYGQIASYKAIADWAQLKYNYTDGNPRVVANLRRKLYELLGHRSGFPLWRLASESDEQATLDSIETRVQAMQERIEEDSWEPAVWFEPAKYHDPY